MTMIPVGIGAFVLGVLGGICVRHVYTEMRHVYEPSITFASLHDWLTYELKGGKNLQQILQAVAWMRDGMVQDEANYDVAEKIAELERDRPIEKAQPVRAENADGFQWYQGPGYTSAMRPYCPGEDLSGVSIRPTDSPSPGGMIARNPRRRSEQWYVSAQFFDKQFKRACEASEGKADYS